MIFQLYPVSRAYSPNGSSYVESWNYWGVSQGKMRGDRAEMLLLRGANRSGKGITKALGQITK